MTTTEVLTFGNLVSSLVAGLLVGAYTNWILGAFRTVSVGRRALLFGWYWMLGPAVLYVARIGFALYSDRADPAYVSDVPRLVGAWILFLLFACFVAAGSYVEARWRIELEKRRLRRARPLTPPVERD